MTFRRALGPFDATMVVIGGIIGSGIFINPYIVARTLDSSALVLGGVGRRRRDRAGRRVRLRRARRASFRKPAGSTSTCATAGIRWPASCTAGRCCCVIESGAIAAVAITFATYALRLVGRPDVAPVPLAIAAIVLLSVVNYFGVKPGSRVLNVLVVLKVGGARGADRRRRVRARHRRAGGRRRAAAAPAAPGPLRGLRRGAGADPLRLRRLAERQLRRRGDRATRAEPAAEPDGRHVAVVVLIYVLVNVVYLRALGLEGLAATTTPASTRRRR